MKETSALAAILQCRCPRCRSGRMFTNSGFNLKFGRRLYLNCPLCNLRFEREPAFFEGAMYFNYAMNVAIMVSSGVATYVLLGDPGPWVYFGISASTVVLLVSFTSRLSKSMMLHFFGDVDYEPDFISRPAEKK
jgi:uncharacterized protein (DUF983 family)